MIVIRHKLLLACVLALALGGTTAQRAAADPILLSPASFIDIATGAGSGSGTVGTGHQVFSFHGQASDQVTLAVEVTEILQGTQFRDDDSKLFLFDGSGKLLALNDDFHASLQSRIEHFTLPLTGTYFAGVTTFPNDPLPGSIGDVISGWEENGQSRFAFNLNITRETPQGGGPNTGPISAPAPEPTSLALALCGALFLGSSRWRRGRRPGV